MRRKQFKVKSGGCTAFYTFVLLVALACLTVSSQFGSVHAAEEDFDDDGLVEEVNDAADIDGEEIVYESPIYDPKQYHFVDHFDDLVESRKRWIQSQAKKDDIAEEIAKYDGKWEWEAPQRIVSKKDIGLVLKSKAKHAAIAARLHKKFTFKEGKPLVVQYEVTMQDGQECGGSYIKLLSAGKEIDDLKKFNDKTPYTIMFGPDKCGNDVKMHFIFRHVNPINGSIEEKHCRKPKDRLEEPFKDKLPHLYQLVVRPDNTFEIRVDHKIVNDGSLLSEFTPPVNPPREIDDPTDQKPEDWDEREKIPDPTAQKPEDWDDDAPPQIPDPSAVKPDNWLVDEPEMIPDPTAQRPEDWDEEIDGTWEAPLVDNPVCEKVSGCGVWKAPLIPNKSYKGKWRAPLIENPNYQGKWAARKIPNPDYFEDLNPFLMTPIAAIGIELWSMSSDILFDNLVITDDVDLAKDFAAKTFDIKRKFIDKESETFMNKILAFASENPWSWRIAIILIGTPLAFSLYRFFSSGGKKDSVGEAKKTDPIQEDDAPEDDIAAAAAAAADVDVDVKEQVNVDQSEQISSHKPKKSDLDVKETADNSDSDNSSPVVADLQDAEDEEKTDAAKASGGATRKRRVRKDQS